MNRLRPVGSLLFAWLLFGDYLMLSLSQVVTGHPGNWLVLVAGCQLLLLGIAAASGALRGLTTGLGLPLLGMLGLGLVCLVHLAGGMEPDEYGTQKLLSLFLAAIPAFLLGALLGRCRTLPGRRFIPWLLAPLLLISVLAWTSAPETMTVEHQDDLALYFGVFVLPVHQALAFALGKAALWANGRSVAATATRPGMPAWPARTAWFALTAVCVLLAFESGSKGYVLAAALAVLCQWAARFRRTSLLGAALAIAAFASFLAAEVPLDPEIDPALLPSSFSMLERVELWQASLVACWERPIFGHGPGGFAPWYGWYDRVYSHNFFLEIASEFGLAGLLCLLAMLGPALAGILRSSLRGEPFGETRLFALGFLVFALVGTAGIGDLIRNSFVFLAIGAASTAFGGGAPRRAPSPAPAPGPGRRGPAVGQRPVAGPAAAVRLR